MQPRQPPQTALVSQIPSCIRRARGEFTALLNISHPQAELVTLLSRNTTRTRNKLVASQQQKQSRDGANSLVALVNCSDSVSVACRLFAPPSVTPEAEIRMLAREIRMLPRARERSAARASGGGGAMVLERGVSVSARPRCSHRPIRL